MTENSPPEESLKLVQPIIKCGWCASSHVANAYCWCEEDCGSSWCGKSVEVEWL